jgi:F-type H+-transporting ATPase subunit b
LGRARAASAAAAAASGLIADQHDAAADKKLVDQAIAGL